MSFLSKVLMLTAILTLVTSLAADEQKTGGGLAERMQDLDLSDEQEAKIASIAEEFRAKNTEAVEALRAVVKEEAEAASAVLTAEQKATLQKAREERKDTREDCVAHRIAHLQELDLTDEEMTKIGEIRAEFRPKVAAAMKRLDGLLSVEQKEARQTGLQAGKNRREILASLNLNGQQKEKVAAVGKEVGALVREEAEKIRDLLTETQKEQLQEFKAERPERVRDRAAHRIANLKELNLTDDQKAKLAAIRQEYRPKVQEAGNKVRALFREELEMVTAAIKG